jgi:hypothetical protein
MRVGEKTVGGDEMRKIGQKHMSGRKIGQKAGHSMEINQLPNLATVVSKENENQLK